MAWMWENVGARKRSWTVGWRDHEGKKQQETFSTKTEARRFKTLKEADRVRGVREPSRLNFANWWDQFIVEVELRPKTRAGYRRRPWPSGCSGEESHGLGAYHPRELVVLRSVLSHVVDLELLDSNPCQGMSKRLPSPAPIQHPTLKPDELLALSEAVDPRYRLLILTMGILGLRHLKPSGSDSGTLN